MAAATALVVIIAVSWTRGEVEGFEDDAVRESVVSEFLAQKGDKPTPEQLNEVLDAITGGDLTVDDVPEQVRLAISRAEEADPLVSSVVNEFRAQTGEKPTMDELNAVVDAVNAGAISEDGITDYVERIVSGDIPVGKIPRNVYRLVVDSFRNSKGSKPTASELGAVLDAIEDGSLKVADVGDFVRDLVESGGIEDPEVAAAPVPNDFDINKAIIDAYLEHAGRRPTLEELKNVRGAIKEPGEALQFVRDTVVKADVVVANVRAASDMTSDQVSDDEIERLVDDVKAGRLSLRDVVARFSGAKNEEIDVSGPGLEALDDADFVDEVYRRATGEDPDPDTSVFLLAKLRSWKGDRRRVANLAATMGVAVTDDPGTDEILRALIQEIRGEDVDSAVADYNLAQATRRPAIGESPVPRMTSTDRAFNMNIGDTDRLLLAATRRSRGPSHDVLREGDNMVLRDDVYWEYPGTKMPCPNQSCRDPEYRNSQTSLIGTLLDSAERTSVGTLMPEFEFRELPPR